MSQIIGLTSTSEIWSALEKFLFAASKARIMQLRLQLQTMKKHGSDKVTGGNGTGLAISHLGTDNNVVVEFYAMVFLVKYQTTKKALVQDKIDSDLYRLCAIKSVGQNAGANCANIDASLVDATSISCITFQLNSNKASH
ncbi:hypothetical protein CK203_094020 [Vitis vinifera]|uniref:Uncharacterized protein n=1 Tax=Vitis vinifera TaxID=29760 RepID=A0A438BRS7_VITVI|nr:hypothetical protein CK203_094020 [Vitis vinifera]